MYTILNNYIKIIKYKYKWRNTYGIEFGQSLSILLLACNKTIARWPVKTSTFEQASITSPPLSLLIGPEKLFRGQMPRYRAVPLTLGTSTSFEVIVSALPASFWLLRNVAVTCHSGQWCIWEFILGGVEVLNNLLTW